MSDTESYLYRYSWDLEDLKSYPWSTHYVHQPEILAYLRHVVDKFDLRKYMHFNTELTSAKWDDSSSRWIISTSTGCIFKARYLITALGLLSRQNLPNFEGINDFTGEMYHTGRWPEDLDLKGKRVGVIGNGSTGVQVVTAIAKDVTKLVSFQRNPQYSVPSGQGPVTDEYRKRVNDNYPQIWEDAKDQSLFGFGFKETDRPTFSVSEEERERIYEKAWQKGGGFRFMFETFGDISVDEAANNAATDFIKRKITTTVKDPEKARKLLPTQLYARRPLCDAGYYEQFNRDHVEVVSLQETPITRVTSKGIATSDGAEHELDVIIFATGFDAVDGSYTRIAIQGRGGETLKEHWQPQGSTSYLGMSVPNFPNLFMILGPNGPFCNLPPAIETQVEFISDIIEEAERRCNKGLNGAAVLSGHINGAVAEAGHSPGPVVEAKSTAEEEWTKLCDDLSANSLFRKTDSWIFGSNVSGKKHAVLFYFAGLASYRKILREIVQENYRGFKLF
ncbi:cyclohexanone monooxygenase [Lentithecium fluviatile CBS 122367]|uniref:Cyclohexanone monooxygenase n=1 Tax=Lentithecium fluviatile CBS 122367 TaxID=1168545 RepID=A0A6G1JB69_9PLEO|nr:cyclohexanone monooxygenase [Lentithecium fluviatile CBS 122367]